MGINTNYVHKIDALQSELNDIKTEKESYENDLCKMRNEMNEKKEIILNLQHENTVSFHKNKNLEQESVNKELTETIQNLSNNLSQRTNKLEENSKNHMAAFEKFKKYESASKKKIEKLKGLLATKKEEVKILTTNVERKQSELESIKTNLEKMNAENDQIRNEKIDFEKYMAENEMAKQELNANINSLNKQNNNQKTEILALTQSLDDSNKLNEDATEQINKLNAQIGIAQSEQSENQQKINSLNEKIKNLHALFQDEMKKEMESLTQSKFIDLNQKINDEYLQKHEAQINGLKENIIKLQTGLQKKENASATLLQNEMKDLKIKLKENQESNNKIKEMSEKYDAMEIELSSIQNKNGKLNKSINILKKKVERFQKQTKKLKDENKALKEKKKETNDENVKNENEQQPVRRSSRKTRAAFKPLSSNKVTKRNKISSDEDSDVVSKPTHRYQLRSSSKKRKRSRDVMERENRAERSSVLRNKKKRNKKQNVDEILLNSVEPTKKRRKTNS